MTRSIMTGAFLLGALAICWIGAGFIGSDLLALSVTLVIGAVYLLGFVELVQFRQATATLFRALDPLPAGLTSLEPLLDRLHPSLQNAVRLRIEGERIALPGPVFAPYLVGLLVMLGLLGTFVGMVVTLKGAVLALQGTTELQAIREGLAIPIQGLGLAFGTSVAGVSASAMLGLIATLSRRERMQATGLLDQRIATELRSFSLVHNRQETFKAMQFQAQALPELVTRLQGMAEQMDRMGQQLGEKLLANQSGFHQTVQQAFTGLASSVETSFKQSLAESGRLAGDAIKPVVDAAMRSVAEQAQQTQARMQESVQQQLQTVTEQFSATSDSVALAWKTSLTGIEQSQQQWLDTVAGTFTAAQKDFQQGTTATLAAFEQQTAHLATRQGEWQQGQLQQWSEHFNTLAADLLTRWQAAGEQATAQQQKIGSALENSAAQIIEHTQTTSAGLLKEMQTLLQANEELVAARQQSEARWLEQQGSQITTLANTLRHELATLRDAEAERGNAAIERLNRLESAVAEHLATLGAALEAPMTRLIDTASEAPKAAAEVIARLREEIANNTARDNELLAERARTLETLNKLTVALDDASGKQQQAVEHLVQSSAELLQNLGSTFSRQLTDDAAKLETVGAQLVAGSAEVASLSEAFGFAVELFRESNEKLIDSFSRIETALDQSSTRSDEQLAYYVAQAREIIDLSMMSQKEVFDELRRISHTTSPVQEDVADQDLAAADAQPEDSEPALAEETD